MRILQTYKETYADGPGIRYSIYCSGCDLGCEGCHNETSWALNQGEPLSLYTIAKIKREIYSNPMLSGITLSGGDPLHPDNAFGTQMLLESLQDLNKHIMVFTGRTLNQLISRPINASQTKCLEYINILVDGPFVVSLRDVTKFKGSTNQRFIRVKDMVKNGELREDKINEYVVDNL